MPDVPDHISQAIHNRQCAAKFLAGCRDWAITAAFYAAIHYVEAGLVATEVEHSNISCPPDEALHDYRQRMVQEKFGDVCFRSYRKLRQASWSVRYLTKSMTNPGTALSYYSQDDVKRFLEVELPTIKDEIHRAVGVNLD